MFPLRRLLLLSFAFPPPELPARNWSCTPQGSSHALLDLPFFTTKHAHKNQALPHTHTHSTIHSKRAAACTRSLQRAPAWGGVIYITSYKMGTLWDNS
eukprot:1156564-Pelagomonas_calceolata.AAC.9